MGEGKSSVKRRHPIPETLYFPLRPIPKVLRLSICSSEDVSPDEAPRLELEILDEPEMVRTAAAIPLEMLRTTLAMDEPK